MFERYTEPARRAIFFARYETSQLGRRQIEPEHLLLGILRQDERLRARILGDTELDEFRKQFPASGEKIATSVDLPLSHVSKRILALGSEEAERAGSRVIGPEHLLAGLLRENCAAAALVISRGFDLQTCRLEFSSVQPPAESLRLLQLTEDLPGGRISGAVRILEAISGDGPVSVTIKTPSGSFTVEFPPPKEG